MTQAPRVLKHPLAPFGQSTDYQIVNFNRLLHCVRNDDFLDSLIRKEINEKREWLIRLCQ